MSHARQQIRDAFVTAVTGLTTTGSRVYSSRVYPQGDDALPGLIVRTASDRLGGSQTNGDRVSRDLVFECEARCKPAEGAGDVDDLLDTICAEVETALGADRSLGNRVRWLQLQGTDFDFVVLERKAGVAVMTWSCSYYVLEADPTTLIYLT